MTIGNLITGRKREYTVEDRTHEVHHVECTLDEVLSDQLLSRKGGSSQDDSEIEGMLYIYDVMNNDVLLSLPSFLGKAPLLELELWAGYLVREKHYLHHHLSSRQLTTRLQMFLNKHNYQC